MNNLFISPKEKHKRKLFGRLKIYALIIVIIFLLWGVFYLISSLSVFKINSLEVFGEEKLSKSQIMSGVVLKTLNNYKARLLGLDNIFSWPGGVIEMNNRLIASASIEKNIWHRNIKININERKKYGAWCMLELSLPKCFWFDNDGFIFDSAPETTGKLIFKINSELINNLSVGAHILQPDLFNNLRKILETLKGEFFIEDFNFNNKNLDLKTKITDGPELIFNLRFDPEINLTALKEIKDKKNLQQLKLIDFRIPNKVFYR